MRSSWETRWWSSNASREEPEPGKPEPPCESDVQTFLPQLISLYQAGQLPIDRLVQHYPQAAMNDAVADMLAGRTIKAVLQMEAG